MTATPRKTPSRRPAAPKSAAGDAKAKPRSTAKSATAKSAATPVPAPGLKPVVVSLRAEPGLSVFVAGSFNNWDPVSHPMTEGQGGYSTTLDLAPGLYEYKFVIEGVWTLDPDPSRDWTQNGLGTLNSVLRVD